jgi:nucleoside-diphosphate-sugar epimerase
VRTIVIGAKGFVGAALVRALLAQGHDVTAIELRDTPGRLADVADHIEWVVGDGSSLEAIFGAIGRRPVDAIYYGPYYRHAAGTPSLDRELDVMTAAAWRVFQLTRAFEGLRVIFPSSIAVHGPQPDDGRPVSETTRLAPFGLYGGCKVACEYVAAEINAALGRNAIRCLRLPSVYGPGAETASRGVNIPAVAAARGVVGTVAYAASARVCIGHVDDVADAVVRVLEAPDPTHGLYEVGGLDVSFQDIADAVAGLVPGARTAFGREVKQVLPNLVDWSRLRDELGVSHRDLRAGMASIIDYERGAAKRAA